MNSGGHGNRRGKKRICILGIQSGLCNCVKDSLESLFLSVVSLSSSVLEIR